MGNWYIRSDNEEKYIVFEENDISKEFNIVAFGMLMNNSISSLIPCSVSQTDNTRIISFNVSSYQSVQNYLEEETTLDFISALFIDMCSSIILLRKYMIEDSSLIFDSDKMYVDISATKIKFLIDPLWNENKSPDLKLIFRNIIVNLKLNDHDSQQIGTILSMLNKKVFSVEGFLDDLKKMDNKGRDGFAHPRFSEKTVEKMVIHTHDNNMDYQVRVENKTIQSEQESISHNQLETDRRRQYQPETDMENKKSGSWLGKLLMKKKQPENKNGIDSSTLIGIAIPGSDDWNTTDNSRKSHVLPVTHRTKDTDATVIEADSDVTDILVESESFPKLINKTSHMVVVINKDNFTIGRDPMLGLDLVLGLKSVSHHHATIKCIRDSYYIVDENSTNHIYINGRKIPVNSDFLINNGDTIKIGSEEFVFEI